MKVSGMIMEIFLLENGKIYITGLEKFFFFDSGGDQFFGCDKMALKPEKPPKKIKYRCPGSYCR